MEHLHNMILDYEKEFFDPTFCVDTQALKERMDANYLEYGQTGTIYHRDETIDHLSQVKKQLVKIHDFHLEMLCKCCCIAHYRSENNGKQALRTSIWVEIDQQWKLKFHQGTPVTL